MSTQSRDPKGDKRAEGRKSGQDPVQPPTTAPHPERVDISVVDAERELGRIMFQFSNWDHGYLKARRSPLGSDLHLTWTWTMGPHSGSYVYARVEYWRITFGLEVLSRKVFRVDEGLERPSPDRRNPARTTS
jgi:hypothetical protein